MLQQHCYVTAMLGQCCNVEGLWDSAFVDVLIVIAVPMTHASPFLFSVTQARLVSTIDLKLTERSRAHLSSVDWIWCEY